MKPAPFTYHRATTATEAVEMLAAAGDEGGVLAGGQSLVPLMNFRVAQPLGVRATEVPATPARIVGWIEAAGQR